MATYTTTKQQARAGAAARKVGGYHNLVRLSRELEVAGPGAKIVRRNGQFLVVKPAGKGKTPS